MRALLGGVTNRAPVSYTAVRTGMSRMADSLGLAGREQHLASTGANGTLFSIVNELSTATSQVKWCLYRSAVSGLDEDRVKIEHAKHLAAKVWHKPNPFFTQMRLIQSVQQHVDLTGEGHLVVYRDPRATFPLELWPVRPDRMMPIPDPEQFLVGWIYRSPSGELVPLDVGDVLSIIVPDPMDPYRGKGAVQSIITDLNSARMASEWNKNFFANSATPGGIVEFPVELNDTQWKKFVERWRTQHQGVSNAHRVATLERGAKWVSVAHSMREMQFAELVKVNSERVREAFAIHGHTLGISESVNRANAEAADVTFARLKTVPRLRRWQDMLNTEYLPMFGSAGDGVEFDFENPVPEDRELVSRETTASVNAWLALVGGGVDPKSASEFLGMPELDYTRPAPPTIAAPMPPGRTPGVELDELDELDEDVELDELDVDEDAA